MIQNKMTEEDKVHRKMILHPVERQKNVSMKYHTKKLGHFFY